MRITSYQCRLVTRASSAVLPTSYGAASETRPHVIVGLQAGDGRWGLGESSPLPNFTGETAEQVLRFMLEQEYLPAMVGLELFNQRQVDQVLGRLPANRAARCAVDVALHDLRAQTLGLPLYRLLGAACPTGLTSPGRSGSRTMRQRPARRRSTQRKGSGPSS